MTTISVNNSNTSSTHGIVFIDPTVTDYQSLLDGVLPGNEVIVLDPHRDGVGQISEVLANRSGISSVQIVSHGSSGSLQLGNTQLSSNTLNSYSNQLQGWANALTDDADIFLYGCDVAAGEKGTAFVQQLSQLTKADVAASTDLTGSAAKGANWNMEFTTGSIESSLVFSSEVMENYSAVLANNAPTLKKDSLVYRTSIDPYSSNSFEVYNTTTNTWTTLGSVDTSAQLASSGDGTIYMLNRVSNTIQRYVPETNTWVNTISGPPALVQYGNLEVTNDGEFIVTQSFWGGGNANTMYYTTGGVWNTFALPGSASALADYDPTSGTFVVSREGSQQIWKIDPKTLNISTFNVGASFVGEIRRFGEIYNGSWYSQYDTNPITKFDLSNNSLPIQNATTSPIGFYSSSAVDDASGVFYINTFDSQEFLKWDSVTNTFTPLAPAPTSNGHNTLAFSGYQPPKLTTITEDNTNNPGNLISEIFGNSVTDVDAGALKGIAVTGLNGSNGTWQYSINGGATFLDVGAVGESQALLLRPEDKLRFLPDTQKGGTPTITYRAWDQTGITSGQQGTKIDASTNGGSTAFSNTTATATITVNDINDTPTVANPIAATQSATEDSLFGFQFAANTFSDVDAGDNLTYTATLSDGKALPTWLSFNSSTRTFSGTPTNGDVSNISIKVTAKDTANATADASFNLAVANINDAPTVANIIAAQTASAYTPFNFQFAANTFNDIDTGDSLTYTATQNDGSALPSWLSFDAAARTFSGILTDDEVGLLNIKVTASDTSGSSISNTFALNIALPENTATNTINGDSGNNVSSGGAVNDLIDGGAGNDTLNGNGGDDNLNGGDGKDLLRGGVGKDILNGGVDNDTLYGDEGDDTLVGSAGIDILRGGVGNDILDGGADNDTLYGDAGNDTLFGGFGIDILRGGDADDILRGGAGNDSLYGDAGNDTLFGGSGNNMIWGGAGNDQFVLASGQGYNTIRDFTLGDDRLSLNGSGLTFAQLTISKTGLDTSIGLTSTGEVIAKLTGMQASLITPDLFV